MIYVTEKNYTLIGINFKNKSQKYLETYRKIFMNYIWKKL